VQRSTTKLAGLSSMAYFMINDSDGKMRTAAAAGVRR